MPVIMDGSIITVIFVHLCCFTLLTFDVGFCEGSSEILCIPSEREALLKVKHRLRDPTNRLSSWDAANTNCCDWAGVVCSNVTYHILQLHLNTSPPTSHYYDYDEYEAYERSMFGGDINPSLVDLKHLNYLDLSGNDFGGMQIPSFLGVMASLTYLNLSQAGFGRKIPHQIGNLSNLLYLGLRTNYTTKFSGKIPYQIGNLTNLLHLDIGSDYRDELSLFAENLHWLSGLSSLQYLDLGSANLSKSFDWLEVMQTLPSLVELHLSSCPLHGYNQPSTVNFSSLVTLDLSYSYALGASFFPKWIFGLKRLVSLQLRLNDIHVPIPEGIQNLTLLENLDLSGNSFSSPIPDWLYGFHHLKFLSLGNNNFRGTISYVLGNLTSLVSLDLTNNQLEGMIPTSLGNLYNLREIYISNFKCKQQISKILEILIPCVSNGLETLEISSSQLSGQLTDQIGAFKNLVALDLWNNSIHGELPSSLGKLSRLRYLDLSNNQFNGNPFETLSSLSKLSSLDIDDNLFQGVVKEADLANFTRLYEFTASGNNLTLKVGPDWRPSFQATILEMTSWQLGPNFPSWIQSQKHLRHLEMSNTGISDSIPTWFWQTFSQVSYFNLSHNHIRGELPSTLKNPISMSIFDLSSNQFTGQLPNVSTELFTLDLSSNSFSESMTDFLCHKKDELMSLEFLNLASNNLSGEIPDCWIMWPYLVDVNLQSNYFIGNLPPSMGYLAWLQSLHIRNNRLSGIFPTILKNTSKLISLDLGENKLTGSIPTWVGERLSNMKILRLRSNKFLGHIPDQICALNFLQILDLAQNNLSGKIPNCFNCLSAMMIYNSSSDSFIYSHAVNNSENREISVLLWLKGRGDEYRNTLGLVTSIDLSDNKLSGDIPREITNLSGLIFLNLSKNQLTGQIPRSIGNMGSLESIDFSRNQLSGQIPPTMSNLSFLSKLDLSYNHLKGKIPTGTQLQSFEASNFVGNKLCGPPLPVNCSSDGELPNDDHNDKESDGHRVNWFFVSMAFGFVVGFWAVVAPLFIYRSWRYAYFRFLDDMWNKLQSCW